MPPGEPHPLRQTDGTHGHFTDRSQTEHRRLLDFPLGWIFFVASSKPARPVAAITRASTPELMFRGFTFVENVFRINRRKRPAEAPSIFVGHGARRQRHPHAREHILRRERHSAEVREGIGRVILLDGRGDAEDVGDLKVVQIADGLGLAGR